MPYQIADSAGMERLGAALATACPALSLIYLYGPLGAGKTTLVRGFLRAVGVSGTVKSPTYTLVEPYQLAETSYYHFDLYRLEDPEALEMLGFRDYLEAGSVCLIEWPEQAGGLLSAADISVSIEMATTGRSVSLEAATERGASCLKSLRF